MSSSLLHPRNTLTNISEICHSNNPRVNHVVLNETQLAQFRTQLCESHKKSQCKNSDSCPHSHCLTWQRRDPYHIHYSAKLCPEIEFIKRRDKKMNLVRHCNRGRSCTHAHSKEEELYHPLMYKTKMCCAYPKCNRYFCPFAHSQEEIRKPLDMEHIRIIWGCQNQAIPARMPKRMHLSESNNDLQMVPVINRLKQPECLQAQFIPNYCNKDVIGSGDLIKKTRSKGEESICGSTTVSNSNSPKRTLSNGNLTDSSLNNLDPKFSLASEPNFLSAHDYEARAIQYGHAIANSNPHPYFPVLTESSLYDTFLDESTENDNKVNHPFNTSGSRNESDLSSHYQHFGHKYYTKMEPIHLKLNHERPNYQQFNKESFIPMDPLYNDPKHLSHENPETVYDVNKFDESQIIPIIQMLISSKPPLSPVYMDIIIQWLNRLQEEYKPNITGDLNPGMSHSLQIYMELLRLSQSKAEGQSNRAQHTSYNPEVSYIPNVERIHNMYAENTPANRHEKYLEQVHQESLFEPKPSIYKQEKIIYPRNSRKVDTYDYPNFSLNTEILDQYVADNLKCTSNPHNPIYERPNQSDFRYISNPISSHTLSNHGPNDFQTSPFVQSRHSPPTFIPREHNEQLKMCSTQPSYPSSSCDKYLCEAVKSQLDLDIQRTYPHYYLDSNAKSNVLQGEEIAPIAPEFAFSPWDTLNFDFISQKSFNSNYPQSPSLHLQNVQSDMDSRKLQFIEEKDKDEEPYKQFLKRPSVVEKKRLQIFS